MSVVKNFREHNLVKLDNLHDCLTSIKWNTFCSLPYLLHYNHPEFPGYGDGIAPFGFSRPSFYDSHRRNAVEIFPQLKKTLPHPASSSFLALYAMGSVGSACFTSSSDVDFWLIHASGALEPADRGFLETKLRAIEDWAWSKGGLEVHFYLHDLGEIQKATFSYDKENAGEFGPILKEEFLRTATYICGAEPSYWGETNPLTIDFGPIPRLSTRQYLAACLMLLEKALEKPFKASLKIALLRKLAAVPESTLPAELLQERIAAGKSPDSYMLLLDYLWEYFLALDAEEDHQFLKKVLYLKMVSEEESPGRIQRNTTRLVKSGFQSIGDALDLDDLNSFFKWPFSRRIDLSDRIVAYLQDSLREISQYPDARNLPAEKFQSLTRKIRLRSRTGNFITSLTFADVPTRGEPSLSFVKDLDNEKWILSTSKFVGKPDTSQMQPLHQAAAPVPLLAFAVRNKLLNPEKTEVRPWPTNEFPKRHTVLAQRLTEFFRTTGPTDLNSPEEANGCFIIMEQTSANKPESRRVTNLIRTTWGETAWDVHSGESSLAECLDDIVKNSAPSDVWFFTDLPVGPEEQMISRTVLEAATGEAGDFWVIADQSSYLLITPDKALSVTSVQELLFRIAQLGRVNPRSISDAGARSVINRIFNKPDATRLTIHTFIEGNTRYFLLSEPNGTFYAWRRELPESHYSLAHAETHLKEVMPQHPVRCLEVEYKKGMQDPWWIKPAEGRHKISPGGSNISLEIGEDGRVAVLIGDRATDAKPMNEALQIVAKFITAVRKSNSDYPSHISKIRLPPGLKERITASEALKMKHELESKVDLIRKGES